MNRNCFQQLYAALNFCFFCFKTKDNEKRKKYKLKYKFNKCIEILSEENAVGNFILLWQINENVVKKITTKIYSNTRILIISKS